MIDTFKEIKNKGILSKQCIKRVKPIRSTDAEQARVPTLKCKNKNNSTVSKLSFIFCPLWFQVVLFFARQMGFSFSSHTVAFSRVN